MKLRLLSAIVILLLAIAAPAPPASAQAASSCGSTKSLKSALNEMSTNDPVIIDRNLKQYTAAVAHWRQFNPGSENAATRLYDDAVDFWREKKANLVTGGMVDVRAGGRWASYLHARIDQIERCRATQAKSGAGGTHRGETPRLNWNGTWYEGPYTMQVSGGFGSVTYTALRDQGQGTCCPLKDQGSGTCAVKGNEATCTWHMLYDDIPPTNDGGKKVDRTGHGTLTFIRGSTPEEDSIQYTFVQDKGKITLGVGTCPDIKQCTGMHPGAKSSGYWSRKKP
jgi:hypothetical protein